MYKQTAAKVQPFTWISLALIVIFFIFTSLFRAAPLFEGPDEIEHYRYIQFIARNAALSHPTARAYGQFHQPPLYYLLTAPLLSMIGSPSVDDFHMQNNPHYPADISIVGNDNKNLWLHDAVVENESAAQAVASLRLFSTVIGVGILIFVAAISRLLFSSLAMRCVMLAVAALIPQFIYLSSVVNNDVLLIFWVTAALYVLLYSVPHGLTRTRAILLGLLCGAVLLTKTTGAFFVVFIGGSLLLQFRWRQHIVAAVTPIVLIAGWWYARNLVLYQDPFLTQAWRTTWSSDVIGEGQDRLRLIWDRLPYVYETIWARFGGGSVAVQPMINRTRDGLMVVGLAGLMVGAVIPFRLESKMPRSTSWIILVGSGGCWLITLFVLASQAWAGVQGRYLLPGLVAWSALLTLGIFRFVPTRMRRIFSAAFILPLGWGALVATLDFVSAYRPLPALEPASMLNVRYEDAAELIGVTPAVIHALPGEVVMITLHWRALGTPDRALKTFVHSIDAMGEQSSVIRRDSYPGNGNLLTQDWQPGMEWAERYIVRVPEDAPAQQIVSITAGLYDAETLDSLPAQLSDGSSTTGMIAVLILQGFSPSVQPDMVAQFGNVIVLTDWRIQENANDIEVCLDWVALRDGDADVRRFVHGFDSGGQFIGQTDGDPSNGAYPARYWRMGEQVIDCVLLPLTDVTRVSVGWYDPVSGERLAAVDGEGQAFPELSYSMSLTK